MTSPKPILLFIPGAWHKSTCYTPVMDSLHTQGYETATAELASVGATPGLQTWAADISNIQAVLAPLVSAGKRIIIIAHSYSSLPAGEAIKPYLARDRSAAGVVHMVYISAFVIPPATSLMDALHNTNLPWFIVAPDKLSVQPADPANVFYNDLPQEVRREHVARLQVFSYQMYFEKTTWAPWECVPVTYVFCTRDNAIPIEVQEGMVKGAGARFREVVVEAGHSPFLSKVEEVVGAIVGAAESG